jgi:hypothetical protein
MTKKTNHPKFKNRKGSSLVELVLVTVLFAILVPASLGVFVSGSKISGQSYIQHQAAVTLGEVDDIIRYMRNLDISMLPNGDFYLIRSPGTGSWLVKSDLPDKDIFERHVVISSALRHTGTKDLYMPGDTGASYEDLDTKKIDISILWAPDYIPMDLISHTIYITDWTKAITYDSA